MELENAVNNYTFYNAVKKSYNEVSNEVSNEVKAKYNTLLFFI
jgi:hypothetical protein